MIKQTKIGEWDEIQPQVMKFDKAGDCIEGELLSREESKSFKNMVYKIQNDSGLYTVFGTSVLDSMMKDVKDGSYIKISFDGTKENKNKGQNPIKLFKVFVKKR
jgi:hypothetical protein